MAQRQSHQSDVRVDVARFLSSWPRHDPLHEVVEERYGERRVAVGRAVDHALGDERVAYGSDRRDFPIQDVGDIARSVGPGPELRHGSQVALLGRCHSIEAHAEKARVEFSECLGRCAPRVVEFDRGSMGDVPGVFAPLLEEVGIAARPAQDFGDRAGVEGHTLLGRRHNQGVASVIIVEAIDGREFEQSLGVGLGVAGPRDQPGAVPPPPW